MSKHIAIKDFKDMLVELNSKVWLERGTVIAILKGMADLPRIDIVYCVECERCRDELIEEHMPLYIYCEKWKHETDFDGFCSYGERMGGMILEVWQLVLIVFIIVLLGYISGAIR